MTRPALNKSSLSHEQARLRRFSEFLPSLDMKRRQLLAELARARRALQDARQELQAIDPRIAERLPMLADQRLDLHGLVRVTEVRRGLRNVMGVRLPQVQEVRFQVQDYALLGRPPWVDELVGELKKALRLRLVIESINEQARLLDQAVRKVTQRVNLFDKVLIPDTRGDIRRIQLYLSEQDRAAVVRAKLAKAAKEKRR
jgi:V/A-type H+-transporting ATPase subunit D